MGDYKLSASLAGHDDDVRAVLFPYPNELVSASRDGTVRAWKMIAEPLATFEDTIIQHGSSFINALAYLPPSEEHIQGLVVSGGKETIIEVRQPKRPAEESAEALLLGHANNVCALDVGPDGKYIISGGWDSQARLWSVGKWETEVQFEGHQGSVLAVLAYDSETIITGCADNLIRIFHISGKLLKTVKGSTDVVRALCKVPKRHPSGADFASAGNDTIIRLWTLAGNQVGELLGHENFIYSLASIPTGELVSSGEDRTVRVWKGAECVQTITHPAISVWSVAANQDTGDIVTGASDRIVRIFSREEVRQANEEAIQAFEESVRSSAIPQEAAGDINKESLPGPDFLQNKSGTKEGQVQMIKENNGSITAHQWSASQGQWINVGTVVDSVGSSGKKTSYLGKDYDCVFDVDVEEGKPPLKLPYNYSQNPYEAARKFVEDNKLPIAYLDQVSDFITTNTKGTTLGAPENQGPPPAGADPWGSENRYRPGGGSNSSAPPAAPKILPQKEYLNILVARVDIMENKIKEINRELIDSGSKAVSLNPEELEVLSALRSHLEAAGSTSTSQDVTGGLELAIKLAKDWPYAKRLPGLDLLRLLAVAPDTATYKSPRGADIIEILESSVSAEQPPAENNVMLAIRAFGNLFATPEGRRLASHDFDRIFSISSKSLEGKTTNRNLLVAVTTLAINYSVLVTSSEDAAEVSSATRFEQSVAWLECLAGILNEQKDSEVLYRAMIATGTLLGLGEEVRTAAKEVYGIYKAVTRALGKAVDPRIKNVGREIKELLK
ncbi:hypothetical protein VE02_00648 [Pseudogymnoascus sp. 03VT05]|nr:hypothetical protein VE02_00648 [Pseudogymnoascus sp. 03VT05]